MKIITLAILSLSFILSDMTDMNIYNFDMKTIDGEDISLSKYQGKKILIVNVASKCGYTPQYEDLQALHEQYGNKVEILGFPANNFGGQEPGSNLEIAAFCEKNYGVTFQMFEKISVKGSDQHPLYAWLAEQTGKEPTWNFCKYLIDENGNVLGFFPSGVNPMDEKIIDLL
ncbi:glutathione peroxidase [Fulvivirga sedimenti]|uniref:Glutathione peroxidase n=1 Tax=Fulvivirga sedimenti TaxID=2879465 RepID=A0A9X1HXI6_9BACT|nr:glutathione peroxidase [Fulvivirga sedimenti]MCA6078863.1 glutathione peroxidase [Fulvivirga sedimenti]